MTVVDHLQVYIGAKFVSGQPVCLCSGFQVFQSAHYVSGDALTFSPSKNIEYYIAINHGSQI
jgi:hypothetical protein